MGNYLMKMTVCCFDFYVAKADQTFSSSLRQLKLTAMESKLNFIFQLASAKRKEACLIRVFSPIQDSNSANDLFLKIDWQGRFTISSISLASAN